MNKPAGTVEPTATSGLFTRQSSGLVRELGIPAATAIALASVAVVNTFINFSNGLISFNKPDMVLPLILAAAIWFVAMFAYKYLLQAIPRAGGEYVYVSRVISPALGAMVGIGIAVAFTYILAANAQFTAIFMPFTLTGLGDAFSSSWIASGANHVSSKGAIALICVGMMLVVGVLSLWSLRRVAQIILAPRHHPAPRVPGARSHPPGPLAQRLRQLVRQLQPQPERLQRGAHDGEAERHRDRDQPDGLAARRAVHGAELQRRAVLVLRRRRAEAARPHVHLRVVISIALLVVVWVGIWVLLRWRVGLDFMQAQANLGASHGDAYGKITSLSSPAGGLGYGLVLSGDPITKILFAIAVPCAELAVNLAFVAVITRVLFSLAFDRMLPVSVAKVNDRTHGPINATIIAVAGGIGFSLLATYLTLANIVANLALFVALILLAGAVAALLLPWRRPELIYKPGTNDVERYGRCPERRDRRRR